MNEVRAGRREFNVLKQERGWKLFLLIPRFLLRRPARGGLIPRRKLRERFKGRWVEEDDAQTRRSRVSRICSDSVGHRAARGGVSCPSWRVVCSSDSLEGAPCAPGDDTLCEGCRMSAADHKEPGFPSLKK